MASPNIYFSGIGGTAGATLATISPLYASGTVWYVHSASGTDAVSPRGKDRSRPLATLAQAITNASAGDIIVCLSGHSQTLTAIQTISLAGLTILGEGSGSNRPTFTRNANDELFDITGAGVWLDNLYFPASSTSTALGKVRTAAAGTQVTNCLFEAGANDTGPQLETVTGASAVRVYSTTFTSTSTTSAPLSGIQVTNALSDMTLDTVVFDGGTVGWSDYAAIQGLGAITRLRAVNIDLLNDSDISLATGSTGYIHTRNKSGSARVIWTA